MKHAAQSAMLNAQSAMHNAQGSLLNAQGIGLAARRSMHNAQGIRHGAWHGKHEIPIDVEMRRGVYPAGSGAYVTLRVCENTSGYINIRDMA